MTRTLLYEAASCMLTRYGTDTSLAILANGLRHRMGYKKVIVALARKLTTLMLSMWKSETSRPRVISGTAPQSRCRCLLLPVAPVIVTGLRSFNKRSRYKLTARTGMVTKGCWLF